jgi:hypothetical protein
MLRIVWAAAGETSPAPHSDTPTTATQTAAISLKGINEIRI